MSTRKAFSSTHQMDIGIPLARGSVLSQSVQGPIRFLVGNQQANPTLTPGSVIKRGDTLSPSLFSFFDSDFGV